MKRTKPNLTTPKYTRMKRYELHITRRRNWFDDDNDNSISLHEWKNFIKENKDLCLNNTFEAKLQNGQSFQFESEELAVWTGYSRSNPHGNQAWFNYWSGNISVKNPDDEIIYKMVTIAGKLNAKVQGTNGEVYSEKNFSRAQRKYYEANIPYKRWWRLW